MMRQNQKILALLLILVLLVSACGQEEALPTAVAFPTEIPPTATEEIIETATSTPVANPTLPPTWTFTPDVTETPMPTDTEVPFTVTPLPAPDTVSAACDLFAADPELSTREFIIGEAPVAAWTSIEGAALYRVFLTSFSQEVIFDNLYIEETSYTFDPTIFELGENYVWAVWPLDSIGVQMCFERGLELLPKRPPVDG